MSSRAEHLIDSPIEHQRKHTAKLTKAAGKVALYGLAFAITMPRAELLTNVGFDVGGNISQRLPATVAQSANRAVHIDTVDLNAKDQTSHIGSFSGVDIGNGYYVTAGHPLTDYVHDDPKALSKYACANAVINGVTKTGKPYSVVPSQVAYVNEGNFGEDIAVYHIDGQAQRSLAKLGVDMSPMPITTSTAIDNNVSLFFANYQPASDSGYLRDPFASNPTLQSPAIFAGDTIASYKEGTIVDITHSYGVISEIRGEPGSSGGLVVDQNGVLRGLSNFGVLDAPDAPHWIKNTTTFSLFGLGPFGLPGDVSNLSGITRINEWEVQALEVQDNMQPVCASSTGIIPDIQNYQQGDPQISLH
jgi:hypothetical protein